MRADRLLSGPERGSATVEAIFAIVVLALLTLGAVQVAFVLYARNVLMSAAHEGARAAVERGAGPGDAQGMIEPVVRRAAGGLLSDIHVAAVATPRGDQDVLTVTVSATVSAPGPVPIEIPVTATATAVAEGGPQ